MSLRQRIEDDLKTALKSGDKQKLGVLREGSIAGRLLVYLPQDPHIGISQRIEDESGRQQLRERVKELLPPEEAGGFIVRTLAEDASTEELAADIAYLRHRWQDLEARSRGVTPPRLLYQDLSVAQRVLRDMVSADTERVLVMQPQATAHGITLTAADTVVFYGPLMSVEMYLQCIARADRKGQDSDKVTVVHIQSSPIETRMFRAMERKVNDHTLLVEMFDQEIKEKN